MRLRKRETVGTRLGRVYAFLWDGMYDPIPDEWPTWLWGALDRVETAAKWALCKVYGHEPIRDQCGRPEHDHCAWCGLAMPEMAGERV